jgi:predicted double-glycine peptidase
MFSKLLKNNQDSRYVSGAAADDSTALFKHFLARITESQHTNTVRIVPNQGFASPAHKNFIARFYGLASSQNLTLLNMQAYQQTEEYTCGAATIMSLLYHYGLISAKKLTRETELQISADMGTSTAVGTTVEQIAKWLDNNGFIVNYGENGTLALLQNNLKTGIPTLVEWMDWGGHWSVVAGYDSGTGDVGRSNDTLFLADSSAKYNSEKTFNGIIRVNANRFKSMWFDAQYFKPGQIVKGIFMTAVPKK